MSTTPLRRTGSLCAPDPHEQLLSALLEKDLERFLAVLRRPEVDPDRWLDDPHHATCLELACADPESGDFVEALLAAGADPSRANPARKTRPVHVAARAGNPRALTALLASPGVDAGAVDGLGNTALHVLAKHADIDQAARERCLSLLLDRTDCRVDVVNRKGHTALHLAVLCGPECVVRAMLLSGKHGLEASSSPRGRSTRDVIIEKFPDLESLLSSPCPTPREDLSSAELFQRLYHNDCSSFVEGLASVNHVQRREVLESSDGSYTLLQLACERGLTEAVKLLLDLGADPDATAELNPRPAAVLAAYRGYYHVLEWFAFYRVSDLKSGADGGTVLHAAVLGARCDLPPRPDDERDHHRCLRVILSHIRDFGVDVNQQDVKGNTALHYAAGQGDASSVTSLLRHGANIGVRNAFKEPPVASIDADTLETFLDECLETNGELPREENFEVVFKYGFLAPPSEMSQDTFHRVPETDPLLYISRSRDLRDLLKHPVFTSFLFLKWLRMRRYYYTNLALYSSYTVLLTVYVLFVYSNPISPVWFHGPAWALLLVFYLWFIVRELFQMVVFLKKYFLSPENYMEIVIIAVSGMILFAHGRETQVVQPLSAISILLSWAELVLLVGRHPKLSTNIEMLKRVTWNFLKFLAWYSILILAFALSFYTLFHDCGSSESCRADEGNLFAGPATSVFKTVVMLTGEFDAANIPFLAHPGTSHVVFLLFVFLVAIVLFNLLNALAVCDTQAIRNDAELVGLVSRVNLVFHFERIILGKTAAFLDSDCPCWCPLWCGRSTCRLCELKASLAEVSLFPGTLSEKAIRVLPNQNSRVVFSSDKCERWRHSPSCCKGCQECRTCHMDQDILRAAMDRISGRRKPSLKDIWEVLGRSQCKMDRFQDQITESNKRLRDYGPRFDDIDRSWKHTEEKMDLIIEWLRTVNNNNNFNREETKAANNENST